MATAAPCSRTTIGLAQLMREIRVHGQDRRYHHPRLGLTGRLDSIQAAVLLAKLEMFDDEVAARARLGARYAELIEAKFGKGAQAKVRAPHVEPFNTSRVSRSTRSRCDSARSSRRA